MRPERYGVHRFIGRKPHDLIASLITRQTRQDEVILDPFVGSGTTACEALILRRRVIAGDLDPFAVFLTRMLCISPVDLGQLAEAYSNVSDEAGNKVMDLYSLEERCNRCGVKLVSHWVTRDRQMVAKPICPKCLDWSASRNRRLTKAETDSINQVERTMEPDLGRSWADSRFTARGRLALLILSRSIERQRGEAADLLRYAFSANLAKSSLLNTFRKDGKRWILNDPYCLSIPAHPLEFNVWMGFQNKYRALLREKAETNRLIGTSFEDPSRFASIQSSVTELCQIGDGTVHHIITDPPYSETISYSDLHRINRCWLGLGDELGDEIKLEPDIEQTDYVRSMTLALDEMARTLKKGGSLTIVMEGAEGSLKAYRSILQAGRSLESLARFATARVMHRSKPYIIVRSTKKTR